MQSVLKGRTSTRCAARRRTGRTRRQRLHRYGQATVTKRAESGVAHRRKATDPNGLAPSAYRMHAISLRLCEPGVGARVEHPFRVIKCHFGHRAVRYRGLAKNTSQLHVMFGLPNRNEDRMVTASANPAADDALQFQVDMKILLKHRACGSFAQAAHKTSLKFSALPSRGGRTIRQRAASRRARARLPQDPRPTAPRRCV